MNIPLVLAALLSALTIAAHVIGGGPEIHDPVLVSDLSAYLIAVLSVVWHGVTAILIVNSLALAYAAFKPQHRTVIVMLTSAQYLFWAGLFILYGLKSLGSLWPMPQWTVFILVPALALFGLWKSKINSKEI